MKLKNIPFESLENTYHLPVTVPYDAHDFHAYTYERSGGVSYLSEDDESATKKNNSPSRLLW